MSTQLDAGSRAMGKALNDYWDKEMIKVFEKAIGPPKHGEGLTVDKMKRAFKLGEYREHTTA